MNNQNLNGNDPLFRGINFDLNCQREAQQNYQKWSNSASKINEKSEKSESISNESQIQNNSKIKLKKRTSNELESKSDNEQYFSILFNQDIKKEEQNISEISITYSQNNENLNILTNAQSQNQFQSIKIETEQAQNELHNNQNQVDKQSEQLHLQNQNQKVENSQNNQSLANDDFNTDNIKMNKQKNFDQQENLIIGNQKFIKTLKNEVQEIFNREPQYKTQKIQIIDKFKAYGELQICQFTSNIFLDKTQDNTVIKCLENIEFEGRLLKYYYEGMVLKDKDKDLPNGLGRAIEMEGQHVFEGQFLNGKMHGPIRYIDPNFILMQKYNQGELIVQLNIEKIRNDHKYDSFFKYKQGELIKQFDIEKFRKYKFN